MSRHCTRCGCKLPGPKGHGFVFDGLKCSACEFPKAAERARMRLEKDYGIKLSR